MRAATVALQIFFATLALATHHAIGSSVATNDLNSPNWSGVIDEAPENDPFTSVSATIVVPTITGPSNAAYSAYAWVGIDGWGGFDNLFQAGLDVRAVESNDGSYVPQFRGFFEWYPNEAKFFAANELPLSAGDTLCINITAFSPTSGRIYLENERTEDSRSYTFNEPEYPLIGRYAEWIVEEFETDPLPSPATFTFQSTAASTRSGKKYDGASGSLVQVEDGRMAASLQGSDVTIET